MPGSPVRALRAESAERVWAVAAPCPHRGPGAAVHRPPELLVRVGQRAVAARSAGCARQRPRHSLVLHRHRRRLLLPATAVLRRADSRPARLSRRRRGDLARLCHHSGRRLRGGERRNELDRSKPRCAGPASRSSLECCSRSRRTRCRTCTGEATGPSCSRSAAWAVALGAATEPPLSPVPARSPRCSACSRSSVAGVAGTHNLTLLFAALFAPLLAVSARRRWSEGSRPADPAPLRARPRRRRLVGLALCGAFLVPERLAREAGPSSAARRAQRDYLDQRATASTGSASSSTRSPASPQAERRHATSTRRRSCCRCSGASRLPLTRRRSPAGWRAARRSPLALLGARR